MAVIATVDMQVVIVPIVKNEADKDKILAACQNLHTALQGAGVRCKLDERLDRSPGFKFNDYEMRVRPVPLRCGRQSADAAKCGDISSSMLQHARHAVLPGLWAPQQWGAASFGTVQSNPVCSRA